MCSKCEQHEWHDILMGCTPVKNTFMSTRHAKPISVVREISVEIKTQSDDILYCELYILIVLVVSRQCHVWDLCCNTLYHVHEVVPFPSIILKHVIS